MFSITCNKPISNATVFCIRLKFYVEEAKFSSLKMQDGVFFLFALVYWEVSSLKSKSILLHINKLIVFSIEDRKVTEIFKLAALYMVLIMVKYIGYETGTISISQWLVGKL